MVRKVCCDPLKKHPRKIIKALIPVPKTLYKYLGLQAGQMICKNCHHNLVASKKKSGYASAEPAEVSSSSEEADIDASSTSNNGTDKDTSKEFALGRLNVTLPLFDITPVKTGGLTSRQKAAKVNKKLELTTEGVKRDLERSYGEICGPSTKYSKNETNEMVSKVAAYDSLMGELKETFNNPTTPHEKKLQILTLSPLNIHETEVFFGASNRMVKKSRSLKKKHGILPQVPRMSKGRVISQEEKNKIIEFYESDEVSRMCPGQKDKLMVRNKDGVKEQKQKRLVLSNLKELYEGLNI